MMQRLSLGLAVLAVLASIAHAESSSSSATSSVINVQLPTAADAQNVMGSIMGVDATATSYYLTCPTDTSSTDCSLGDGFELVEGPSVLAIHMTESALGTIDISCGISSNTASCTTSLVTFSGTATASSAMVTSTGTALVTGISSYSMPVTVTAGLEKLPKSGSAPRMTQNAMLVGAVAVVGGVLLI